MTPNKLWLSVFALWVILLSGVLARFVGSPGALQLLHLKGLLKTKLVQAEEIQHQIDRLELASAQLEQNRAAQEREIRRVLGYTASDEIIFDFSSDKD